MLPSTCAKTFRDSPSFHPSSTASWQHDAVLLGCFALTEPVLQRSTAQQPKKSPDGASFGQVLRRYASCHLYYHAATNGRFDEKGNTVRLTCKRYISCSKVVVNRKSPSAYPAWESVTSDKDCRRVTRDKTSVARRGTTRVLRGSQRFRLGEQLKASGSQTIPP